MRKQKLVRKSTDGGVATALPELEHRFPSLPVTAQHERAEYEAQAEDETSEEGAQARQNDACLAVARRRSDSDDRILEFP